MVVSSNLLEKMDDYNKGASNSQKLRTTDVYFQEEKKKYVAKPIDVHTLTSEEQHVFSKKGEILGLIGGKPSIVRSIEIVDQIYESDLFLGKTVGLWQPLEGRILIKRTQLSSISDFAGTLLHECAHALSHEPDVSRGFENKLTEIIGLSSAKAVELIGNSAISND